MAPTGKRVVLNKNVKTQPDNKMVKDLEKQIDKLQLKFRKEQEQLNKKLNRLQESNLKKKLKYADVMQKRKAKFDKEKMKTRKIRRQLSNLQSSTEAKKVKKRLADQRKECENERKRLLKAQSLLRESQERNQGEPLSWRICTICCFEFTEEKQHSPRVLNCGDTFCYDCIKTLKENDGYLQCPECRGFSWQSCEKLSINKLVVHK